MNINESHIEKIKAHIFHQGQFKDGFEAGMKTLWRMSHGSQSTAYKLIRDVAKHYGFIPTDFEIEIALGEMNGGIEVEWKTT